MNVSKTGVAQIAEFVECAFNLISQKSYKIYCSKTVGNGKHNKKCNKTIKVGKVEAEKPRYRLTDESMYINRHPAARAGTPSPQYPKC